MNYFLAFIIGGALCVPAQILIDKTRLTSARILSIYLVSGIALSAIGLYKPLVNFASCGATVPLSGFGNALVQGTKETVTKDGLMGVLTGPLTASAAGISAAIFMSIICALVFKSKQK